MTDKNDPQDNNSGRRPPLVVSRRPDAGSGTVKQSFSHGRSKQVVVETKKKRIVVAPPPAAPPGAAARPRPEGGPATPAASAPAAKGSAPLARAEDAARALGLSESELRARREALNKRREEEDRRRAEREAQEAAERARQDALRRQAEEEERRRAEAAERSQIAPAASTFEDDDDGRDAGRRNDNFRREVDRRNDTGRPPRLDANFQRAGREAGPARGPAGPGGGGARVFERGPRPPGPSAGAGFGDRGPRPGGPPGAADRSRFGDRPPARDARPGAPASGGAGFRPRPAASAVPEEPVEVNPLSELGGRIKTKVRTDADAATEVRPASKTAGEPKRRQGKLTISAALDSDDERQRSLASVKRARARERDRRMRMMGADSREKVTREVVLPETITVQELANRMAERVTDVVKFMMKQGDMVRSIDVLDADTAQLIVEEFGHTVKRVADSDVEIGLEGEADIDEAMVTRPPVVTIMGHVDHGKTSLLDALRQTDVVSGEAGGITQHIGAYQVVLKSGEKITFLDTPGHAAFSSMRARGANATDIVVLVVAADDGVMPQTIEAIQHAKAAGAPLIVAVNKIDKYDANPDKVLTQLLQYDVVVEAMSGDVQAVKVSALNKTGLDDLTDAISVLAEVLELKANPDRSADGVVIESQLDKGRGPVATVLVQRGTLKRGDIVVAGGQWGRVRALVNERGQQLDAATPSMPVEILGLDGAPDPGDQLVVVENEQRAREITEYRNRTKRNKAAPAARASLEQLLGRLKEGGATAVAKEAVLVVKGDVQGTVEAITQSLEKLSTDEVRARVALGAVGGISESDVQLAASANAPIIAFNVRANKQARDLAEREGVEIRYYSVIYDLINDVKDTLSGMLPPERRETFLGYANILQVFNISKVGKVAGCRVSEGVVKRGCGVRLLRDDVVIHEGTLSTLKRFKDEVAEVKQGVECGMAFVNYQDIREGDQIECFQVELITRKLA